MSPKLLESPQTYIYTFTIYYSIFFNTYVKYFSHKVNEEQDTLPFQINTQLFVSPLHGFQFMITWTYVIVMCK